MRSSEIKRGDWLVHMDMDVCVVDQKRKLEDLVTLAEERNEGRSCDVIFQDSPHSINGGFLMFKSGATADYILRKWHEVNIATYIKNGHTSNGTWPGDERPPVCYGYIAGPMLVSWCFLGQFGRFRRGVVCSYRSNNDNTVRADQFSLQSAVLEYATEQADLELGPDIHIPDDKWCVCFGSCVSSFANEAPKILTL